MMNTQNTTKLYTCKDNTLTEITYPRCEDCARFKPLYTRDLSGHYTKINVGCCKNGGKAGGESITWRSGMPATEDCKHFIPADPAVFKQVWIRTPAN